MSHLSSLGNKKVLAKNLSFYIERSGKDRRELAEAWGFPYSTVTEWINGRKYPRIDKIEKMADYFGIQKSDLIEEKIDVPMSKEEQKKSDAIVDITVRLHSDKDFFMFVDSVNKLTAEQFERAKGLMNLFFQEAQNEVKD